MGDEYERADSFASIDPEELNRREASRPRKQLRNGQRMNRSREADKKIEDFREQRLNRIQRTRSKSRDSVHSSGRSHKIRKRRKSKPRLEDRGAIKQLQFSGHHDEIKTKNTNFNDSSSVYTGRSIQFPVDADEEQNYAEDPDDDLISKLSYRAEAIRSANKFSCFGNLSNIENQKVEDIEKEASKSRTFDGTLKKKKLRDKRNRYKHTGKALISS